MNQHHESIAGLAAALAAIAAGNTAYLRYKKVTSQR
jgi:hypothetical protein